MNKISLIIPSFNESKNVGPFLERTLEVFRQTKYSLECIFIDDGSQDNTYEEVKGLEKKANDSEIPLSVVGIQFSRNFGKEAALLAGLEHCTGNYISMIDADLQQDPSYVLDMVEFLERNSEYDIVACYQERRKENALLRFCKRSFYKLANTIGEVPFEENASDFRTMRKPVAEAIMNLPEYNRFSKGLFSWVGFRTYYMPYKVNDRLYGQTTWTIRKLFRYALDGFIGFSSAPLKASAWCGGIISAIAFIYTLIVILQRIVNGVDVPGYATVVCLILIIGGLQMVFMGIIGEYIARMFMEVKNRPNYIIRESFRKDINFEQGKKYYQ